MDALCAEQRKMMGAALSRITKAFEEQIAKLMEERDSERYKNDDGLLGSGENRESEKEGNVDSGSRMMSAGHNAFMYSVIEICKMMSRNVEDYLKSLLERLLTARDGDDLTSCFPCYLSA